MKVSVDQLDEVWQSLILKLRNLGVESVEIDEDYYWKISDDDLYNIYKEPKDLGIGSLVNEWSNLEIIVDKPDKAIVYAFSWFSEILRAISIKQPG